jgi:hypothetical protein
MAEVPTLASEEVGISEDDDVKIPHNIKFAKRPTRPIKNKHVKEENQVAQQRKLAVKRQAKATVDMVATNMRKVHILHDQAALLLFTMPNKESLLLLVCKYLGLCREEKMAKLKRRFAKEKAAHTKAAEEAKEEADTQAVEGALATQNRVILP